MNTGTLFVSVGLLLAFATPPASGQEFPVKPIRIIVAFPPGGTSDITARLAAQSIADVLGVQGVVENRPGASGIIGSEIVAKSAPDGYTLLVGHIGTLAVNPALFPKLPYHPVRDFQPITLMAKAPSIMVVHPSLPVKTVKEFIAIARKNPGAVSYGSAGNGSAMHLGMAYLSMAASIDLLHVPYKGTGPALLDVVGGRITTVFPGLSAIMSHVQSGRLRAVAVASTDRAAILPDVPTFIESGLANFEVTQWWGILAPARTPQLIVAKLNQALLKGPQGPDTGKQLLDSIGAQPAVGTPENFHEYIKTEIARWGPIITKASGVK